MRKIRINWIVGIVAIAMISLLLIQFYQVSQQYNQKSEEFKDKVNTLIERIAIRHEKAIELRKYMHVVNKDFSPEYKDILKKEFQNLLTSEESITIRDTVLVENGKFNKYLLIQGAAFDTISGLKTKHQVLAKDVKHIHQLFNQDIVKTKQNQSEMVSNQLDHRVMRQIFKKSKLINEMLFVAFHDNSYIEPEKRIDIHFLDSVIAFETRTDNLPSEFRFAIKTESNESVHFCASTPHYSCKIDTSDAFKTVLFPSNMIDESLYLYLKFPTEKSFIFHEMFIPFAISLLLVLLMVYAISYMFRTIITQKKLSELKNDFISNMTHEFKTPISTISLACQAMSDQDMMGDSIHKASPFVTMIHQENKRLELLVERILQSASIDKKDIELKKEEFNLSEVVKELCNNAQFRIKDLGGEIIEKIEGKNMLIVGDKMHTVNVISNLIDNAIKYSKEVPHVYVTLSRIENSVFLSIKDEGIGIPKAHISKIFDKLYRIPTGNVHNVKGFGLGLSYVKAIVTLNGWKLDVKSQENIGSEFTIQIPLN
jgi:two-component system, OmpR family, phosphate regulon sensor histidine kinase PhoR